MLLEYLHRQIYSVYCFLSLSHHTVVLGILSLLCVFVCCTVTDFSAAEKDRGVKFCMRVGLLSGQASPLLVNFGLRGVTGAAFVCFTSGMNAAGNWCHPPAPTAPGVVHALLILGGQSELRGGGVA